VSRREAKARTTNPQQGDREFLEAACRFLPACSERQVRMAPEKCECSVWGAGLWAESTWGLGCNAACFWRRLMGMQAAGG
jgi:hypothetical protein